MKKSIPGSISFIYINILDEKLEVFVSECNLKTNTFLLGTKFYLHGKCFLSRIRLEHNECCFE